MEVKIKKVYFQRHVASHDSVGFKRLLSQRFVDEPFLVAQKRVNNNLNDEMAVLWVVASCRLV
jgi:hypothetical protein